MQAARGTWSPLLNTTVMRADAERRCIDREKVDMPGRVKGMQKEPGGREG